jgi:protein YibB
MEIDLNTTLVTGLYDIGRENWNSPFNRSYSNYFKYFENVLSLNSNIVIYIDEKDLEKVIILRSKIDPDLKKTKIILNKFTNLETYKLFYSKTKSVMKSDFFIKNRWDSHTPEMLYPEYNIINFNKLSFLEESIKNNWFHTEYYMWIDAGFQHHNFPEKNRFISYPNSEKIKILEDNKIHFLLLNDYIPLKSYFDPHVNLAGSLFAGKKEPILKFKSICFDIIEEFLNNNSINDDQTIYSYAYERNKDMFNLKKGNWFENFSFFL